MKKTFILALFMTASSAFSSDDITDFVNKNRSNPDKIVAVGNSKIYEEAIKLAKSPKEILNLFDAYISAYGYNGFAVNPGSNTVEYSHFLKIAEYLQGISEQKFLSLNPTRNEIFSYIQKIIPSPHHSFPIVQKAIPLIQTASEYIANLASRDDSTGTYLVRKEGLHTDREMLASTYDLFLKLHPTLDQVIELTSQPGLQNGTFDARGDLELIINLRLRAFHLVKNPQDFIKMIHVDYHQMWRKNAGFYYGFEQNAIFVERYFYLFLNTHPTWQDALDLEKFYVRWENQSAINLTKKHLARALLNTKTAEEYIAVLKSAASIGTMRERAAYSGISGTVKRLVDFGTTDIEDTFKASEATFLSSLTSEIEKTTEHLQSLNLSAKQLRLISEKVPGLKLSWAAQAGFARTLSCQKVLLSK